MATRYNYTGGIVTDGLVLHLDAAKRDSYPGSGTDWKDLTGSAITGSLEGAASFSGVSKSAAIQFDGTGEDVVKITSPHTGSVTNLTYEVVFKGSKVEPFTYVLHDGTGTSTGNSFCTIGWYGDNNYIYGAFNGRYAQMTDPNTLIDSGSYYHAVVTWDGTFQRFYINADEKNSEVMGQITYPPDTTISVGGEEAGNYRMLDGDIAQVRIYTKALSADEISQNFNALRGRYGI